MTLKNKLCRRQNDDAVQLQRELGKGKMVLESEAKKRRRKRKEEDKIVRRRI